MGTEIKYRYNILNINSTDTFANVSGGFTNNTRDVYFVRALGETGSISSLVEGLDEKLTEDMKNDRLKYLRLKQLPVMRDLAESSYYAGVYDAYKKGAPVFLKKINNNAEMAEVIACALGNIVEKYRTNQSSVTDSMIRNFATKILFWLDSMGDIFKGWTPRTKIKIVTDNLQKEQEYLFYFFLTNLCCDVLLIQNRSDVNVSEGLKLLSATFRLGAFGNTEIKEFTPKVKKEEPKQRSVPAGGIASPKPQAASNTAPVVMTIPKHPQRRNTPEVSPAPSRNAGAAPVNMQGSTAGGEKSFEELALLASSIVLIGVHDTHGDIIATGSGIMIGRAGYILTNNHVVKGGFFYSVRIEEDENVYTTNEVIKYNSSLDLAIIRIQKNLKPLPIYGGSKKLVRGQKVVAIGSPLGLFNSVSDGIISGFRTINDVDMIQFTAPISHGSSGGAVLNMQGEVIGISTAGIDSGQNINLAVGYESIRLFASGFLK